MAERHLGKMEAESPILSSGSKYVIVYSMSTAMTREIRTLVRKSAQEAIEAEVMRIRASLVSLVSNSEMVNVRKLYKKPARRAVRSIRAQL